MLHWQKYGLMSMKSYILFLHVLLSVIFFGVHLMRIILSPSKTQNHQCRIYPQWTLPPFLDKSKLLVEKLRSYDVKGLATLMKR